MSRYSVILTDPPWSFTNWSKNPDFDGRSARQHYSCMSKEELLALDIQQVAERDCLLLMWCTAPHLDEGVDLMRSENWGFTYKSFIPWFKMTADSMPRVGLGYHVRSCCELLLIGTRGKVPAPPPEKRISCIFNPIGRHSAKPDQQYSVAESYEFGNGNYLEMFARSAGDGMFGPRPGWTYIGNEVTGNDIAHDLALLAADNMPPAPGTAPPAQRHSETSVAAAESVKERTPKQREAILAFLKEHGPVTDEDLAAAFPHLKDGTVRARRIGLFHDGFVVKTGQQALTRAGRQAELWTAAPSI